MTPEQFIGSVGPRTSVTRDTAAPSSDVRAPLPTLLRRRWRQGLAGASVGLLAAVAYRAGDFPGALGGHAYAFIGMAAISGALIGLFVRTPILTAVAIVLAALTALVTLTPVLRGPVHDWIRHDTLSAAPLDAVVVLSSTVNADGVLDAAGTERLVSGLALAQRLRPRLLVTTRVAALDARGSVDSDGDQRALIRLAGDTATWHVVAPVHSTRDEAERTAELMAPAASRTIAVVTSPMHSRRACAAFEAVGFHVVCTPSAERRFAVYSLRGPVARIHALAEYVYERLAVLEYRARGWQR
jgi:uncharacterized SAM-binding protein YcdF (DUF218 family)